MYKGVSVGDLKILTQGIGNTKHDKCLELCDTSQDKLHASQYIAMCVPRAPLHRLPSLLRSARRRHPL